MLIFETVFKTELYYQIASTTVNVLKTFKKFSPAARIYREFYEHQVFYIGLSLGGKRILESKAGWQQNFKTLWVWEVCAAARKNGSGV